MNVREPSEAEVAAFFQLCNNWGRWGADDELGTLNLITPAKVREAVAAVRSGDTISIGRPLNSATGMDNPIPVQHFLRIGRDAAADYLGLVFHGHTTTHLDALCHVFWQGRMWNGRPQSDVTSLGARRNAISAWASGIVTRGVLLDIPLLRGADFVTVEQPVRGWELAAAAEQQQVDIAAGDALLVYSGRDEFYQSHPELTLGSRPQPGLHVDTVPFFRERDVALLGWDMMDARPTSYRMFEEPRRVGGPIHVLALVFLGLPLLDNVDLQPLRQACAERGRWDFLLSLAPLIINGATGSPVNPLAVL